MYFELILSALLFLGVSDGAGVEPRKYGPPGQNRPEYGNNRPPAPNPTTQATTVPQTQAPVQPTQAPVTAAPPAATTTTTESSSSDTDLPPVILAYFINDKRKRHGSPPITIDPTLTSKAKKCANYYQATKEVTKNSNKPEDQPENLCEEAPEDTVDIFGVGAEGGGGLIALIDTWYSELTIPQEPATAAYDYKKPDLKKIEGYAHALQLVWKEATKCGCGSSNKPIAANASAPATSRLADEPEGVRRKRSVEEAELSSNDAPPPPSDLTYSADPDVKAGTEAEAGKEGDKKDTTAPQHVHVCVCDVAPSGRLTNYVKNVPAPR